MAEKLKAEEILKSTKQIYVFIGPEGSGKTETALSLSEKTGLPYVSTGNILRDLFTKPSIAETTSSGKFTLKDSLV